MKEIRSTEGSEFRIVPESRKVEGYALLFNTESQDLGGFREVILPEAIDGVVEKSDILALYNHIESNVLARSTNGKGTLSLKVDEKGLKYSFDAPKTSIGEEVIDAITRGDLRNSSFAFTVAEEGQKWEKRDENYLRTITKFDNLFDVSPVYRPAYLDTTVAAELVKRSIPTLAYASWIFTRSLTEIKENVIPEEVKEEVIEKEEVKEEVREEVIEKEEIREEEEVISEVPETEDMIDIVYENDVYSIPRMLIQEYINERKFDNYLKDLESSIEELKKK